MTLTIEVPAEVESALEAKARLRGVPVDVLLRGVVNDFARTPEPIEAAAAQMGHEERTDTRRRLLGFGIAAGIGVSSEDVHRERRAESETGETA